MGKCQQPKNAKIADSATLLVTYSKRRKGLFKKASELCRLCGACTTIIVFSLAGKPCSFDDPSAEEVILEYIRRDGEVEPQMNLTEQVDWIEDEWDSSVTEDNGVLDREV
ncbi:hypothetical protein NL676_038433 [Syzygium grande]|nr:hypothetical protein NL676_038433 [Syzygium grande]